MQTNSRMLLAVAGLSASFTSATLAQSFTAVPVSGLGGTGSNGLGVNDAGHVVGVADTAEGDLRAFYWDGVTTTNLGTLPDGGNSVARSINNAGVIVGEAKNSSDISRAVKWERDEHGDWVITDLGTLNAADSGFGVAQRISNSGHIVGYATAASSYHAFIISPAGVMTDLGTLGYTGPLAYSQGLGVNDLGQAVGYAYRTLGGPEHAARFPTDLTLSTPYNQGQAFNINSAGLIVGYVSGTPTQGAFRAGTHTQGQGWTLLPVLEGDEGSFGYDLNDAGDVVGTSFYLPTNTFRGFIFSANQITDLNAVTSDSPGVITEATDISDTGYVVGTAAGESGPVAVLLRPDTGCAADFDESGAVTSADITAFLSAWFADLAGGTTVADFDDSGATTSADITAFLSAWFEALENGC